MGSKLQGEHRAWVAGNEMLDDLLALARFRATPDIDGNGREPPPPAPPSPGDMRSDWGQAVARAIAASGWDGVRAIWPDIDRRVAAVDPDAPTEAALAARLAERWQVLGIDDLLQPPEPPAYLVHSIVRTPSLVVPYGPPGELKTMLLLDLAVCVAAGVPWLAPLPDVGRGGDYAVTQGPVLIVDQDNGPETMRERVGALCRARDVRPPISVVSLPWPQFNAGDRADVELLAALIGAQGAVLTVIDNLAAISGGRDENTSQMGEIMSALRWVSDSTHSVLAVIHHPRKASKDAGSAPRGEALRGHSSILATIDLALEISRQDDDVHVTPTKERRNPVAPFTARWTYGLTAGGALDQARFWHIDTRRKQAAQYVEIGEQLDAVLRELGEAVNQTALRQMIRNRFDVGDGCARDAIGHAATHNLIHSRKDGDHATAPTLYWARSAGQSAKRELPL